MSGIMRTMIGLFCDAGLSLELALDLLLDGIERLRAREIEAAER
jgi:hypothetical protein